jgi:hypothetical protein
MRLEGLFADHTVDVIPAVVVHRALGAGGAEQAHNLILGGYAGLNLRQRARQQHLAVGIERFGAAACQRCKHKACGDNHFAEGWGMHRNLLSLLQWAVAYLGLAPMATGNATEKALDAIFAQAAALNPKLWAKDSGDIPTRQAKFERFALVFAGYLARARLTPAQRREVLEAAIERLAIGLREAGVGDMAVSKEIRAMAGALHGRLKIYENTIQNNDKKLFLKALSQHKIPTAEGEQVWKADSAPKHAKPKVKAKPAATGGKMAKGNRKKHLPSSAKLGKKRP